MRRLLAKLAVALALLPSLARAEATGALGPPVGVTVTVDLGGGGTLGRGADTSHGLFEGEVGVGYELPMGLRPEIAFLVGLAPGGHVGVRPGLHFALPDSPFYLRGAFDWATARDDGSWRWLLLGGGSELRLTDVLGGFAEGDVGVPLGTDIGVGFLLRAGVSFRF